MRQGAGRQEYPGGEENADQERGSKGEDNIALGPRGVVFPHMDRDEAQHAAVQPGRGENFADFQHRQPQEKQAEQIHAQPAGGEDLEQIAQSGPRHGADKQDAGAARDGGKIGAVLKTRRVFQYAPLLDIITWTLLMRMVISSHKDQLRM